MPDVRFQFGGDVPALPPGFVLDQQAAAAPPAPPPGFVIDAPAAQAQPAPPAAPQGPSALHSLAVGAQAVGRGAADAVTWPFDIAAGVQNLITSGINYLAGTNIPQATPASQLLDKGIEAVGIPTISKEQMSSGERLGYDITRYGTQGLAMGAPLSAAAGARVAQAASGAAPRVGDAFLRPYFANPASAVVGDVASGAGSGAAINTADEYVPKEYNGPVTQMAAAMAGGMAGATAKEVGAAAGRGVGDVFTRGRPDKNIPLDPTNGMPVTKGESAAGARMVQGLADNSTVAAANIRDNADAMKAQGLPQPTIGLVSNDIGLQSAESAARTKKSVPFIKNDNQLRAAATEKVNANLDPGANQMAPRAVAQQTADARIGGAQQGVDQATAQTQAAQAAMQQEGAPLAAMANEGAKASASQRLDTAIVDQGYVPARTEKNRQFDTAPGRAQQLPAEEVTQAAERVRQQNNTLRPDNQIPEELMRRIDALAPKMEQQKSPILDASGQPIQREVNVGGPGTALGGDLADTRKYIRTATETARNAGNFDLADSLQALGGAINRTIEQAPGYAEANANYRQFADTYRPNPKDPAAQFTRQIDRNPGRGDTPPSATAGRFLSSPEKAQALQRMIDGAQSPAEGQTAVRDYLRSDFASSALNPDGTINPNRASAWMRNNADVLGQFPQARQEMSDIAARAQRGVAQSKQADTALKAAQQNLKTTQQDVERSAVGTLLREDPRDVAQRIFSGKSYGAEKELDQIKQVIGKDEAARRGWKAAVSEVLADKVTGTAKIDAGAAGTGQAYRAELSGLDKLFKDNENLLTKVYTPEEMNNLRQAHAVLEPLKNATVRATGGSNTADKSAQMWRLAEAGLKAKYGILKGGGILRTMRVMAATLPDDSANVQRLVERAWFNPDLAEYLLTQKIRNLDGPASNAYVRRVMAGAAGARASGPGEN